MEEKITNKREYCEAKCMAKYRYAFPEELANRCYWECFNECCSKYKCLEMY